MAIFLVLLAGAFVALSNLFMRKSIDSGGTTKGFLVFQMLASFVISLFLEPIRTGNFSWNAPVATMGILAGLLLAFMLISLGKALEKGPPGFTFSILCSSTVMPAVVMALLFDFAYTPWHAAGSLLVLGGLFWAGKGLLAMQDLKRWIFFSASMFVLHVALLVLFQYRALLLSLAHPEEIASLFTAEKLKSGWFLPLMFLSSGIVQLYVFLTTEKRKPSFKEVLYGILGGNVNGIGTFFLVIATQTATALESALIFPMYSVATIVLSNFWGERLYKERVNWRACQVCAIGLIIGLVDWKAITALIGF